MREVRRTALVAEPPARIFALIADVERYPEFVPGCVGTHIESCTEREIVATLKVRRGALNTEFTTRTVLEPDTHVQMSLLKGPFRELTGEWRLIPIDTTGCRIEFFLRFAFSNPISAVIFEPLFESTAASLVDAFVARARARKGGSS